MACEALQLSGWIDSDHLIDTAGTDHVAGQPAKLSSTGLWQLATDPDDVLGVFKNDMADDVAVGPQAADAVASGFAKAGVVCGVNKLRLTGGKLKTGAAQLPFAFPGTHTWAPGNRVFINGSGQWDNAPANANDQPLGIVTLAPAVSTDPLEFIMIAPAPFHATVAT